MNQGVIEGLKVDVTGDELSVHTAARGKFHLEQADFYFVEAKKLQEHKVDRPDGRGGNSDPAGECEDASKSHRFKALYFQFLSEHFVKGNTYRFSVDELAKLEIGKTY